MILLVRVYDFTIDFSHPILKLALSIHKFNFANFDFFNHLLCIGNWCLEAHIERARHHLRLPGETCRKICTLKDVEVPPVLCPALCRGAEGRGCRSRAVCGWDDAPPPGPELGPGAQRAAGGGQNNFSAHCSQWWVFYFYLLNGHSCPPIPVTFYPFPPPQCRPHALHANCAS